MKLKKIKESYSDIDSSNAWDAYDLAIEYLGADELCEALAKAMGTDELEENLAYIFRMYEIPFGDDDEDDDFEESVRKNRKIRRGMQEAGRMVNGKVSELSPQHDARKSFYGKAKVVTDSDGTQILYSYNTPVVEIKDGKVVLKPMWDSSATTLRHVKEFLKQNGFEVGSKAQLAKMYGGANESLRRSNRNVVLEGREMPYTLWVLDGDDHEWKAYKGMNAPKSAMGDDYDEFLDQLNVQEFPNGTYYNNYIDWVVIPRGEHPKKFDTHKFYHGYDSTFEEGCHGSRKRRSSKRRSR